MMVYIPQSTTKKDVIEGISFFNPSKMAKPTKFEIGFEV